MLNFTPKREMQIIATLRYRFFPIRLAKIQKVILTHFVGG